MSHGRLYSPSRHSPSWVSRALRRLGVSPVRRRGQNFLVDQGALETVLAFAELRPREEVLEIGPGLGALTALLVEKDIRLTLIEIEEVFLHALAEELPRGREVRLLQADVRQVKLDELYPHGSARVVVVSNVPYSISTDLILWCLENRNRLKRVSLLLQREFAERLAANPGGRDYGSLTLLRTAYARAELGGVIPAEAFYPRPAVESRLVRLIPRDEPLVPPECHALFEQVVHASFSARRKTLLNSLTHSKLFVSKSHVAAVLKRVRIDPSRRAETLSVEEFLRIVEAIG